MTRRQLLRIGGAALSLLAPLSSWHWRAWAAPPPPPPSPIPAHLAGHFPYLTFAAGTLEAFARAYESQYGRPDLRGPWIANQLHTKFLLSTDFFQTGADQTRPLRFVALYDPYVNACYNPLTYAG